MANVTYQYNPFQERVDNDIVREVIKVSASDTRKEFVPRAAPFFSGSPAGKNKEFKLYKQGSQTPLVLGVDYCFAHSFDLFINKAKRNVFGSVVMLKQVDAVLEASYSTIGQPFVLDDAAFAQLVANIVNAPRQADWADLDPVTIPTAWPADPHDQPASQTYDYLEMMVQLKSLVLSTTAVDNVMDVQKMLQEHISKELLQAHAGSKADFGLDDVVNLAPATEADIDGNSPNLMVPLNVVKAMFRRYAAGTLNYN